MPIWIPPLLTGELRMKDRPATDTMSNSPTIVASLASPVRLVMAHFWKAFAAMAVIACLCLWYRADFRRTDTHDSAATKTQNDDDGISRAQPRHFRLISDLI